MKKLYRDNKHGKIHLSDNNYIKSNKKISKTLRDYDYDSRSWKILKTSNEIYVFTTNDGVSGCL